MAQDIPAEVRRIIKEQLDVDEKDIKQVINPNRQDDVSGFGLAEFVERNIARHFVAPSTEAAMQHQHACQHAALGA